jgi:hypothetical protein
MAKANSNLHSAKKEKNNEFYTRREDIESEVFHYKDHLKDKVVYCNCDDPEQSEFFKYFSNYFDFYGLKKLITTHYEKVENQSYKLELTEGGVVTKTDINSNGDFRSPQCIEFLQEADVIITNPPFSLFREYIDLLILHEKKFLVIGNMNAVTYKNIFGYIQSDRMWLGINKVKEFYQPDGSTKKFGNICWYTNLSHPKRNIELPLLKTFSSENYPKYDNFDAIEVSKIKDIPSDYLDIMGVPITFLEHYNPEQFEIVGCSYDYGRPDGWDETTDMSVSIDSRNVYKRFLIKKL